jgi:UDP-glucose 4-epimerase
MRVLVVGGAGFIGAHLVTAYKDDHDVVVFDMCAGNDVRDEASVFRIWKDFKPELTFHMAAQTEVRRAFDEPDMTVHTNVLGALNVLEAARLFGGRLIVASSDKALAPSGDVYSATKRMADELCYAYLRSYKLDLAIVRCANVFGPGQRNETTLVTNTIMRILRGEKPIVYAQSQECVREWLYIADAVEAYKLIANSDYKGAMDVGSGMRWSVRHMVDVIADMCGKSRADVETIDVTEKPEHTINRVDSKIFRTIFPDWRVTEIGTALKETVLWYRSNT